MHPEIKVWLKDIQLSINEIHDFLPASRNFFLFQKDLKTRKAVERNIEIIGLIPETGLSMDMIQSLLMLYG
jgi:uncharacterized protein with HEPN domain